MQKRESDRNDEKFCKAMQFFSGKESNGRLDSQIGSQQSSTNDIVLKDETRHHKETNTFVNQETKSLSPR
eukprot:11326231-Ditylum_brightwellii.AAC.1